MRLRRWLLHAQCFLFMRDCGDVDSLQSRVPSLSGASTGSECHLPSPRRRTGFLCSRAISPLLLSLVIHSSFRCFNLAPKHSNSDNRSRGDGERTQRPELHARRGWRMADAAGPTALPSTFPLPDLEPGTWYLLWTTGSKGRKSGRVVHALAGQTLARNGAAPRGGHLGGTEQRYRPISGLV